MTPLKQRYQNIFGDSAERAEYHKVQEVAQQLNAALREKPSATLEELIPLLADSFTVRSLEGKYLPCLTYQLTKVAYRSKPKEERDEILWDFFKDSRLPRALVKTGRARSLSVRRFCNKQLERNPELTEKQLIEMAAAEFDMPKTQLRDLYMRLMDREVLGARYRLRSDVKEILEARMLRLRQIQTQRTISERAGRLAVDAGSYDY